MTKEEWNDWRTSDTTKEFFQMLEASRLMQLENWAAGSYTGSTNEATVQMNSKAIGQVQLLQDLQELDHERFQNYTGSI